MVRSLDETANAIDESALSDAGDRLRSCDHADIYGFGDGIVAAFDMHRRLVRLGVRSLLSFDIDGALHSAHNLDPNCVALAITTTGLWSATEALRAARTAGAFCIAITSQPSSAITDVAHLVFVAFTSSSTKQSIAIQASQVLLADLIQSSVESFETRHRRTA